MVSKSLLTSVRSKVYQKSVLPAHPACWGALWSEFIVFPVPLGLSPPLRKAYSK